MDMLAPDGPVYQAGTLSGNPLAMAAGLAQLKELERRNGWALLEEIGESFEKGVRDACSTIGKDLTFNRVGSMCCLYFGEGEIFNVDDVVKTDFDAFRKYFWSALDGGVYFAPSPYETGFISMAHTAEDIEKTAEVTLAALKVAFS